MSGRLDGVLRVRRIQRDTARAAALAASVGVQQARAAARDAAARLADGDLGADLSAGELVAVHDRGLRRALAVTDASATLRGAEEDLAARRADVLDADRRVSAVERWDERRRAAAAAELLKAEQRANDERAGARHQQRSTAPAPAPSPRRPR